MQRSSVHIACLAGLAMALALAGCNSDRGSTANPATDETAVSLPKPESAGGSVTGMPDAPGPGAIGPPAVVDPALVDPTLVDPTLVDPTEIDDDLPLPPEDAIDTDVGDGDMLPPMLATEPTPEDAIAVLRSYYAAIVARQYPRAYALWSGGGSASGQSPEQFAAGFADTTQVQVEPGAPGRVGAAAGSRFIEVPVSIQATRDDGSVHRYVGSYTLRRAVVDGASAEQRAWRIASADIREVQ